MRTFLKLTSACLILGFSLYGTASAQSAGAQTFGAESFPYASEAQSLQRENEHKKAIKQLKKGLKLDDLSPYETSTLYQMMSASYYAQGKNDKTIEAIENAIQAGGLSQKDKADLQANRAQINIVEKNYALGAQQLETYFQQGGLKNAKLVRLLIQGHMRAENRPAAVPWAEVMLQRGFIQTRQDHELAIYLFDSPEKRASQMRVANKMYAQWPTDAAVLTQIKRLNVKAKRDGIPTIPITG